MRKFYELQVRNPYDHYWWHWFREHKYHLFVQAIGMTAFIATVTALCITYALLRIHLNINL